MKQASSFTAVKPLTLAVAATSAFLGAPALAQDSTLMLEEVIVTAQKRSESVQDIAASITAIQGEALDAAPVRLPPVSHIRFDSGICSAGDDSNNHFPRTAA